MDIKLDNYTFYYNFCNCDIKEIVSGQLTQISWTKMINIINKEDCVGCNACVQRCPVFCISINEDEQGFLYPKVDISKCIDCGLCERVCPVINQGEPREPLKVYAAINKDKEIVRISSSGGIFYALAESVIKEGGVVFGARFDDDWQVMHDYTETLEGLKAFQGSKYVQSRIGTTYQQAENFLKTGRKVMFTGTPCQIKGLVLFLRKDYGEQLLKVDVICHGVPSPAVWREYLKYITRQQGASAGKNTVSGASKEQIPAIDDISFRDKRLGWEKYGFRLSTVAPEGDQNSVSTSNHQKNLNEFFEPFKENLYMKIFLNDLDLRPSCYKCPAKSGKSCSDITIGDFWGAKSLCPNMYSEHGVSLILDYSRNSCALLNSNYEIVFQNSNYEDALKSNISITNSSRKPKYYDDFWDSFFAHDIYKVYKILNRMKATILERLINHINRMFKVSY